MGGGGGDLGIVNTENSQSDAKIASVSEKKRFFGFEMLFIQKRSVWRSKFDKKNPTFEHPVFQVEKTEESFRPQKYEGRKTPFF